MAFPNEWNSFPADATTAYRFPLGQALAGQ